MRYPQDFGQLAYNEENKKRFLRESRKLLNKIGKTLEAEGVIEAYQVSVNPAGIAVGGDVYGYFYAPGLQHGVLITLTESVVSKSRPDGVICYGQYREVNPMDRGQFRQKLPRINRIVGDNQYVSEISLENVENLVRRMLREMDEVRPGQAS